MSQEKSLDSDPFDNEAALNMIRSKHTTSKLNNMFLDTKVFNQSKPEYIEDLSLPGSLERIDSQAESPFIPKKGNQGFYDIRGLRKKSKSKQFLSLLEKEDRGSRCKTKDLSKSGPIG